MSTIDDLYDRLLQRNPALLQRVANDHNKHRPELAKWLGKDSDKIDQLIQQILFNNEG